MRKKRYPMGPVLGIIGILCCVLALGILMFLRSTKGIEKKQDHCPHETWINGECAYCGYRCPHEAWKEGICTVCSFPCGHDWENNVCSICGMTCEHPSFSDGICETCGFQCPDHRYENGVCPSCGSRCEHDWQNGICGKCGVICSHEAHDPETRECRECGSTVCHQYQNGVCACGAEPEFYDGRLPAEYYEACEHPGTLERIAYIQKVPAYWDPEVHKVMNVYLPYGYDENRQYDVLVLIHGGWDTEDALICKEYDYGFGLVMKNVYDNMMDRKICEPMIIVCPTSYNGEDFTLDSTYEGLAAELRDTVLPYIAEHYGTYAASGDLQDLQAARAHFGIGGVSNGSLFTLHSGMILNFDLFSQYIALSGNNLAPQEVDGFVASRQEDLPFGYFFAGAGIWDDQRENSYNGYQLLLDRVKDLREGENAMYWEVEGEHEIAVWCTEFFNALQLLF